jgi:hypothetical protein
VSTRRGGKGGGTRARRTSIPIRSVTYGAAVAREVLVEHDSLRPALRCRLVDPLRLRHLLVPRCNVRANEVEDALEGRDHHAFDVVRGVEAEAAGREKSAQRSGRRRGGNGRFVEELLRADGAVDLLHSRFCLVENVGDPLAVLGLSTRILQHEASGESGTGRRSTTLPKTAKVSVEEEGREETTLTRSYRA